MGYSQGGDIAFFALAEDPDYFSEKVELFLALGPTIYFQKVKTVGVHYAAKYLGWVLDVLPQYFTLYEFRGRVDQPKSTFVGRIICAVAPKACGSREYDEEEVRANKLFELDK